MQRENHLHWSKNDEIENVTSLLLSWRQLPTPVLVVTHTPPDADAYCSSLAAVIALGQLGIGARFLCDDPIIPKVRYLMSKCPPISLVSPTELSDEEARNHAGILVDFGSIERLSKEALAKVKLMQQLLLVDHHPSRPESMLAGGNILRFILPLSSTCEVLWRLFAEISSTFSSFERALTPETAMLAYVGMLADMKKDGRTHYEPHTVSLFKEMRRIMRQGGIDPHIVRETVFRLLPWERLLAEKVCERTLIEGGIAVAHIDPSLIDEALREAGEVESGWCYPSTECQEEIRMRLLKVHALQIIVIIDHQSLVSLRLMNSPESGPGMGLLARKMGGGGHHDRAAFRLDDALRYWNERHYNARSSGEDSAPHKERYSGDEVESWPVVSTVHTLVSELMLENM